MYSLHIKEFSMVGDLQINFQYNQILYSIRTV